MFAHAGCFSRLFQSNPLVVLFGNQIKDSPDPPNFLLMFVIIYFVNNLEIIIIEQQAA